MAIANGLSLPNPLSNGTTADAVQVMGDYNYLLAALNRALLDSGGGAGMNAQNTQIHNLANGTAANDAVNLSQLGSYALLAGATFTGACSFTSLAASGLISGLGGFSGTTLSLSGAATVTGALSAASVLANSFMNVDGVVRVGFSHTFAGQVAYHLYNAGGVCEWLIHQPDHSVADDFRIASLVSGTITPRLTITPAGIITAATGLIAPTRSVGDNTTNVATTAFVQTARLPAGVGAATATAISPTFGTDLYVISALASNLTINNPTGTAIEGWGIVYRLKDNGTPRTLTWDTQFRGVGVTLPTTTVAGKNLYVGTIYNAADTKWDVVSVAQE